MTRRFDYFALIAGMRTGSNLLEEFLNAHPRLSCHGELFNPHFVGLPDQDEALGVTRTQRDADPESMILAVKSASGTLAGFRFFDGHDRRALDLILSDRRCAKIILSRNPLESFVSLQIARKTKQWWLGDMSSAKAGKVQFDPQAFGVFLDETHAFRALVRSRLQETGQTAFTLDYTDLKNAAVIMGLHEYLECESRKPPSRTRTKAQNPWPLREKVTNFDEMQHAVATLDPFALNVTPDLESSHGAGVPGFRLARAIRLLFMPLGHCAKDAVDGWLSAASGGEDVETGHSQATLRVWMRETANHRRFTIIDHPVARIHDAFARCIVPSGVAGFRELRDLMIRHHALPLPETCSPGDLDADAHKTAFLRFLSIVGGNLSGQSGFRTDRIWATQVQLLADVSRFAVPDAVIRRSALQQGLDRLAQDQGFEPMVIPASPAPEGVTLAMIYDASVERAVRKAYRRDYLMFGFSDWV